MAMNLGVAEARLSLDIADFVGNARTAEGSMQSLERSAGRGQSRFQSFANGFLGFGTAMIAPMTIGLRYAADLEQAMANLNASLGGLDDSELQALQGHFEDVGAASQFSAVQVAAVADEYAKAGFSAEQMLSGLTESTIELAQATGDGLAPAQAAMSQAFNMWSEEVVGAELAMADAAAAADILTIAANESAGGINDIIGGLRNAGPAMAGIGVEFNDAAAAIALFTNYGYSGDEIGTKLTRTLTHLANPTEEAATLMDELGIAAFDMEGNFVGFPALFDQLQTGFEGMGDEARLAALKVMFGAEAFDLMNIAAETGGDPLRVFMELMGESGVAAEQSALRMDTLSAQFGELWESINVFLGSLVSGLLPGLRLLVDAANTVVDALSRLPQGFKTVIGAVAGFAAAIAAGVRALQAFRAINMLLGGTGAAGMLGLGPLLPLLAGLAVVGGGLFAAWKLDIGGVQGIVGKATDAFTDMWDSLEGGEAVWETVTTQFGTWERMTGEVTEGVNTLSRVFYSLGAAISAIGFETGWTWLSDVAEGFNDLGTAAETFLGHFQRMRQFGTDPLEASLVALRETFPALRDGINAVLPVTRALTDAFADLVAGDFGGFISGIGEAAVSLGNVVVSIAGWAVGQIPNVWAWLRDTVIPWMGERLADLGHVIANVAGWVMGVIPDVWAWLRDTVIPWMGARLVELGHVVANVAGWALGQAENVWDWLQTTVIPWMGERLVELGVVTASVTDWIVESAVDLWDRVAEFVNIQVGAGSGGGGISDAERRSGAPMGAGGHMLPAVRVTIGEWDVSLDLAALDRAIGEQMLFDESDFASARTGGESAGRSAARTFIISLEDAWNAVFGGGGGEGAGGSGGAGFNLNFGEGNDLDALLREAVEGWIGGFEAEFFPWLNEKGAEIELQLSQAWEDLWTGIWNVFSGGGGMAGITDAERRSGAPMDSGTLSSSIISTIGGMIDGAVSAIGGKLADWTSDIVDPITEWWNGLWDFELSMPDFDITSALPDISFSVEDIPGYQTAMDTIAEVQRMISDPLGYAEEKLGGGGESDTPPPPGAAGSGAITADFGATWGGLLDGFKLSKPADFESSIATTIQTAITNGITSATTAFSAGAGAGAAIGGALGGGGGGMFAGIASQLQNAFVGVTITPPDFAPVVTAAQTALQTVTVAVTTQSSAWAIIVSAQGAAMAAAAQAGGQAMQAAMTSAMQAVTSAVTAGMATSTAAVTSGVAAMSGAMTAGVAAMVGAITSGMAAATAAVQGNASRWPGIIAAVGGAMAAAGFAAGQAAGQGVASGMLSTLGMVQSAANQIVATVNSALRAAAQIASPSKLTAYIGQMLGMGMYGGMLATLPALSSAAGMMASAATPPMPATGAMAAGSAGNSYSYTTSADFSGATFHNTSRDEMEQWAREDLIPALADEGRRHRRAHGGTP